MAAGDECLIQHAKALTRALEQGAFKKAEALITNIWHPKCLNVDTHRSSPLTLVLSGKAGYFNLYLAKLLVQYGSNLNIRYVRTTPLERVIKMYLDKQESSLLTIGLNGEVNPPPWKLKEQLSELLEILLASGANPTLITLNPALRSTLHKVVAVENPDIDLVMKLYQWGGNFDRGDVHGTTPMMDHITEASRDRGLAFVDKILCEVTELDLNHTNCCNETMFWRAMSAGSPAVAMRLLASGADPTIDVSLTRKRESAPIPLSPIFAPLLQSSTPYACVFDNSKTDISFSVPGLNKVMLCSVFPVVDCTDILDSVCAKLEPVLSQKTRFPMRYLAVDGYSPHGVACLMLGHFKAGLQQLCVRRIMEHLVVEKHCLWKLIIETGRYNRSWTGKREEDCDQWSLVALLSPLVIAILRRELGLPAPIERRFLIEAARLQVGTCFFVTKKPECFRNCQERTRYLAMCS